LSGAVDNLYLNVSLEIKKQTVKAFLDISRAYDTISIDLLCGMMLKKVARCSQRFFSLHELTISFSNGGGIFLSEAVATSGLDLNWWKIVATIGGLRCGNQSKYVQKRCLQRL
jgi:hypothetical protein